MQLHDVICRREAGSGSADLALNILFKATGDRDISAQHHQAFKWRFVAKMPDEGGVIAASDVAAWIRERDPGFVVEANGRGSADSG